MPGAMADQHLAYTIEEAAAATGVSTSTIRKAINTINETPLRAKRVGKKLLIMHDDLVRWLESLPDA